MDKSNYFTFKIEIIKTKSGYTDYMNFKGTEIETLGAIEKAFIILTKLRNKIKDSIECDTK